MGKAIGKEIQKELFLLQDGPYRAFQSGLIPTLDPGRMIGVRTPALRKMAKAIAKREDRDVFLRDLPHRYFEEDQLHAFVISEIKDFAECLSEVRRFLPFVDNWATCDQMSPKVFKTHRKELLPQIMQWLGTKSTYTVRFAIRMLMDHFLGEEFDRAYPEMVALSCSDAYYVHMMVAWYFATALAKQYDQILPFIEGEWFDQRTHRKIIQKAVESNRITDAQKSYLRSLRQKSYPKKEKAISGCAEDARFVQNY